MHDLLGGDDVAEWLSLAGLVDEDEGVDAEKLLVGELAGVPTVALAFSTLDGFAGRLPVPRAWPPGGLVALASCKSRKSSGVATVKNLSELTTMLRCRPSARWNLIASCGLAHSEAS